MVFRYADEILSLGREMVETARHLPEGRPLRLRVGIANVVPKLCARRLLQPALELERPVHLICHEDRAEPELARSLRRRFPDSLDDAPVLMPTVDNVLRSQLDRWFERVGARPRIVAEFDDSALLKEFGADGVGVFPIPPVIEREVKHKFAVRVFNVA